MIPSSLEVERHQVHSEAGVLLLEQMVGHLLSEQVVKLLPGLGGQTDEDLVQVSWLVDQGRVEEHVGEGEHVGLLAVVMDLFDKVEHALDQGVAEPLENNQFVCFKLCHYHTV